MHKNKYTQVPPQEQPGLSLAEEALLAPRGENHKHTNTSHKHTKQK